MIHDASLEILEKTGVRFCHPQIIEILQKNGIMVRGETAFFSRGQIMSWVKKAPKQFTLYARNPRYDMTIGGDSTEFAPGYGYSVMVDQDGRKRPAKFNDYMTFLRLVQQSDCFKMNGGVLVQPDDIDAEKSFPVMLYAALTYSDKCLMGGPGGAEESKTVMEMLEIVFGGRENLIDKPRITTIVNSISPLMYDRSALEKILIYSGFGQPVIISPSPMAGTTGPVTMAGTIALANAEALAGIAVTQMIREGTPVVYGFQTTASDMKTGAIANGSPERALCIAYGAELAEFYGLPSRGGGADNDAKAVSVQSGYEGMMVLMASCQAGMNLVIHSAGSLDGYGAASYEQFMVGLEMIGMVSRYLAGIKINANTLAVDTIHAAGPGGQFLNAEHTFSNFRELRSPVISLRGAVDGDFNQQLMANITAKMAKILADYQKPDITLLIETRLSNYLADNGYDLRCLE